MQELTVGLGVEGVEYVGLWSASCCAECFQVQVEGGVGREYILRRLLLCSRYQPERRVKDSVSNFNRSLQSSTSGPLLGCPRANIEFLQTQYITESLNGVASVSGGPPYPTPSQSPHAVRSRWLYAAAMVMLPMVETLVIQTTLRVLQAPLLPVGPVSSRSSASGLVMCPYVSEGKIYIWYFGIFTTLILVLIGH